MTTTRRRDDLQAPRLPKVVASEGGGFYWGVVREAIGDAGPLSPLIKVQRVEPTVVEGQPWDGTWEFSEQGAVAVRCHPNTFALNYTQWEYVGSTWNAGIVPLPIQREGSRLWAMFFHRLATHWPVDPLLRITDCPTLFES